METKEIKSGAVRIGSGAKLHPAIIDPTYGLIIRCSCPGTKQGGAYHKSKFLQNVEANCRK